MKLPALLLSLLCVHSITAQVFWTEDFGTGCNTGQLATAYSGPNGSWTVTNSGTNASAANAWFVGATENGNAAVECGNDRSLHLGANGSPLGSDLGAAFYVGLTGFCGFIPCAAISKCIESPVINASGYTTISVSMVYIEGGNTIDNATIWYYDGSTWPQINDPAKTFSTTGSPQGVWTALTLNLPASANNNVSIKIGFQWINNDDGEATDPSFAVDDITVQGTTGRGDTTPLQITPRPDQTVLVDNNCMYMPDC